MLEHRGETTEAEAAYRRADERGVTDATFELAMLLTGQNRLAEAEEAFARADHFGHVCAAINLGVLLRERGDFSGAAEAYFRADQRGDPDGAFELATLLAEHDRLDEAEDALLRAYERGHPDAAENLAALREYRRSIAVREPVAVVPRELDRADELHEPVPTGTGEGTSQPEDDRDEEASLEPSRAPSVKASLAGRRQRLAAGLVVLAIGVLIVAANVLGTKGTNAPRSATVAIEQNAVRPAPTPPRQKPQQRPAIAQKPPHARATSRTAATTRRANKPPAPRSTHASTAGQRPLGRDDPQPGCWSG